jgi:phage-related minor tail protein
MATDDEIKVLLTADASQLQAGMDAGAASVTEASASMQVDMDAMRDAQVASFEATIAAQNAAMSKTSEFVRAQATIPVAAKAAAVGVEEASSVIVTNSRVMSEVSTIASEAMSGNFGRIRRSAAALANQSGLLTKLFTPMGIGILAVGVAVYELVSGFVAATERANDFNAALLVNGDAVGMTSDQLRSAADSLAAFSGNSKTADEILQKLASSGRLTGQALVDAGTGASNIMQLTGQSAEQAAKEVEKLGDNPAKAVVELNNKFHFLTVELYEQIKALQQNGQEYAATELAAKAFADNTSERIQKLNEQMGFFAGMFEHFKIGLSTTDKALQKFFDPTQAQRSISATHLWFETQEKLNKAIKDGASPATIAYLSELTDSYKKNAVALRDKVTAEEASAQTQGKAAENAASTIRAVDAQDKFNKSLKDTSHLQEAIAEAKERAESIHKVDPGSSSIQGITFDASGAVAGGEQWAATLRKLQKEFGETRASAVGMHKSLQEELLKDEAADKVTFSQRSQYELTFWQTKLGTLKQGSNEYAQAYSQVQALTRRIDEEKIQAERKAAQEKQQIDQIETAEAVRHAQSLLDIEKDRIASSFKLGIMSSQQEEAQLNALNDSIYQKELAEYHREIALMAGKSLEVAKINAQIEALEDKHVRSMAQINEKAALDNQKMWQQRLRPINQAFNQSINGMIQGTQTMRQSMFHIIDSIAAKFIEMGINIVVNWVANEAAKTTATAVGAASRATVEATAAVASKASDAATGKSQITTAAATGAAKAYQAMVGIPYIGPFIAPVAAAAAFVGIEAFSGSISSARGGWDRVPFDGAMTELHKDEMVLPKHIADPMRKMAKGGGQGGGMTVNLSSTDPRAFKDFLRRNPSALSGALKQAHRQGHFAGAMR